MEPPLLWTPLGHCPGVLNSGVVLYRVVKIETHEVVHNYLSTCFRGVHIDGFLYFTCCTSLKLLFTLSY